MNINEIDLEAALYVVESSEENLMMYNAYLAGANGKRWVSVDSLPPEVKDESSLSIPVVVKDKHNNTTTGRYDYGTETWSLKEDLVPEFWMSLC